MLICGTHLFISVLWFASMLANRWAADDRIRLPPPQYGKEMPAVKKSCISFTYVYFGDYKNLWNKHFLTGPMRAIDGKGDHKSLFNVEMAFPKFHRTPTFPAETGCLFFLP